VQEGRNILVSSMLNWPTFIKAPKITCFTLISRFKFNILMTIPLARGAKRAQKPIYIGFWVESIGKA
jgi:hypothetical protein